MVDHLEVCSAHAQCLRSEQCACAKHTSAKLSHCWIAMHELSGPGSDNNKLLVKS